MAIKRAAELDFSHKKFMTHFSGIFRHYFTVRRTFKIFHGIFLLDFLSRLCYHGGGETGHRPRITSLLSCQRCNRWRLFLFRDVFDAIGDLLGCDAVSIKPVHKPIY